MYKIQYPEDLKGKLSSVLEDAMQEDYNRELEWLWVADLVTSTREREYCLRRALYINPISRKAQHRLNEIAKHHYHKKRHNHIPWVNYIFPRTISHFIITLLKKPFSNKLYFRENID